MKKHPQKGNSGEEAVIGDNRLHKPGVAGSSPAAAIPESSDLPPDGVTVCHTDASIYHKWPEPSATHFKTIAEGPLQYYERFIAGTNSFPESAAMAYGTLLHLWAEVGEDTFWDRVVQPEPHHCTAAGGLNAKGKEWAADQTKSVVTPSDYSKLWAQTRQILANPASAQLLADSVDAEFNVRFPLPNGHRARGRVDGATAGVFYDVKTTREKHPLQTFWRAVEDFHYDIQAAVYRMAAEAIGYEPHSMRFICTSTVWPYLCEVAYLPDALVDRAHDKVLRLADELAARKDMDHWLPDSYGQVHELWVPSRMLEG